VRPGLLPALPIFKGGVYVRKMVPLQLELIEQGRFLAALNEQILQIQRELVQYVEQFGPAVCQGVKGSLICKIEMKFTGREESDWSIKGDIKKQVPVRPPSVSVAISDHEQDGEPALFVQASGSSESSPLQGNLCTKDGRMIDQKTGKVQK
jgi:hypothetical protein